jgi:hypothetical protein
MAPTSTEACSRCRATGYPVRVVAGPRGGGRSRAQSADFAPAILINDLPTLESAYLTALSHSAPPP